jgi:hypothetical protein
MDNDSDQVRSDDPMIVALRRKSPAERLAIAHGMWSHARRVILHVVRAEHPDWTIDQVNREAARRLSHGAV